MVNLVADLKEQAKELELPEEDAAVSADSDSSENHEDDVAEKEMLMDAEGELNPEMENEGKESKRSTRKTKRKTRKASRTDLEKEADILRKFVDFADVVPPIPKKGDFDVKTIKRSKYFFS